MGRGRARLGPQFFLCGKCGKAINSGFLEWQVMTSAQKWKYGFRTLGYVFAMGFISLGILALSVDFLFPKLFTGGFGIVCMLGFAIGAGLTAWLQVFRVVLSRRRTRNNIVALKITWCSIHTNMQDICWGGLFVIGVLAWIIYHLNQPLKL